MRIKWLWLVTWTLLWAGMASCTQISSSQNAYPTAVPSEPASPAGIQTPAPTRTLAAITVSQVENGSVDLTPSPKTGQPGLKRQLMQTQKETVESARKDLAQRLGISIEEVSVLSVIGQEYSPEAFYCQATKGRIAKDEPTLSISGDTILLEARGSRYEYHANASLVIYCRKLH